MKNILLVVAAIVIAGGGFLLGQQSNEAGENNSAPQEIVAPQQPVPQPMVMAVQTQPRTEKRGTQPTHNQQKEQTAEPQWVDIKTSTKF